MGAPQPRRAVRQESGRRGLDRCQAAHRGGQQPGPQRPQNGHGEDGETDLAGQCAGREADPRAVRTPPPLDREGTAGDQQRPVQDPALGTAAVQERNDDGHHHGRASHEDAGHRRFRGAFGRDDGQVEADHPDCGEQGETGPLAGREQPQPRRRSRPGQREQQQTGEAVAQELAARVRVVAKDAVRGEGPADEDTGERGEEGSAGGGGVHGSDARQRRGPV